MTQGTPARAQKKKASPRYRAHRLSPARKSLAVSRLTYQPRSRTAAGAAFSPFKRVSTDTSKRLESARSFSVSGKPWSFSHLLTACRVVPSRSARASWLSPFSFLSLNSVSPKFMARGLLFVMKQGYQAPGPLAILWQMHFVNLRLRRRFLTVF